MAKAKEIEGLDCAAPVLQEIKRTLLVRLGEISALRSAALDFSDIEGVHDMRVATRRLRGLLRDFQPFLAKNISSKRLKTVADALGAVRDADVHIVALEKLAAHESEEIVAGIAEIIDARRTQRTLAREQLESAITEDALAATQKKFIAQLERACEFARGKHARKRALANRNKSFGEAMRDIVHARFAELQNDSRSLYRPFSIEPLHRMRIAAKRLRYAIELCAECYGKSLAPFAQAVSDMQTSLGELHDCDVWIEELGLRLEALQGERRPTQESANTATPATFHIIENQIAANVWLLRHFTKERTKHYRDALALWHEWETTNFHARLDGELAKIDQTFILQPINLTPADVAEDA